LEAKKTKVRHSEMLNKIYKDQTKRETLKITCEGQIMSHKNVECKCHKIKRV